MCNQNEKSSHLDQMNESLFNDITTIINKNFDDKVTASNGIMERLRGETIFIPKSHKKELKNKQSENKEYPVTINPYECLPISLTQIEHGSIDTSDLDLIKQGIIQIKANSVGPYFPEAYFNNDTKILWILKESFIEGPSYLAGDRGGHNQAAEYGYYFSQYGNLGSYEETHPQVLELTKRILISLGELSIDKKTNERDVTKEVMNHICILEANHFPGLAYNSKKSDDDLIREWINIQNNKELIKLLIDFYNPSMIIFGHTLELFDEFDNFDEVLKRYANNKLVILGDPIVEWSFIDGKNEAEVLVNNLFKKDYLEEFYVWRNIKYLGKSGRCYLQVFHPTYKDFINYPDKFIEIDCNRLKKWRSN